MAEPTTDQEPTPPESASEAKITKPKSPGRVAAGKRLAEMNKKNKAKKEEPTRFASEAREGLDINPGYVIGGLGLTIAAGSLYLAERKVNLRDP